MKRLEKAVFPGYLFARFALERRREIESLPGVMGTVGIGGDHPLAIDASEIDNLRRAIAARPIVLPCPYVAGQTVEIARGPLAGTRGIVTRTKGAMRLVIAIEILRRAVSVEVDAGDVA